MRSCILTFLFLALAAAAQALTPEQRKWISLFERSYGSEGLYVVEVAPSDPDGSTRLKLQTINTLFHEAPTSTSLVQKPYAEIHAALGWPQELMPEAPLAYAWDPGLGLFVSNRGPKASPIHGVLLLMTNTDRVRARLANPDGFTRKRWRKLYEDPAAPQSLKRELELREFLLEHWNFPQALLAEQTQRYLALLNRAVEFRATAGQMPSGTPIALADLEQLGLLRSDVPPPEGFVVDPLIVGKPASGKLNGFPVSTDPNLPRTIRERRAKAMKDKYPDYPPAVALAARFQDGPAATRAITLAISRWPDTVGLRLERLTTLARNKNYGAWQADLDRILDEFPAAPLLLEIERAATAGGLTENPVLRADLARLLADIRPDLLAQQLHALKVLADAGDTAGQVRILERLSRANPAWRAALSGSEKSQPAPSK